MQFEQLLFIAISLISGYILWKRILCIRNSIRMGKKTHLKGKTANRWRNLMLIALGQKKMFDRMIPAFLHVWVYLGFFIINVEIVELLIDGVAGTHRFFSSYLGDAYILFISIFEFFAVAVLIACSIFLVRRNVLKIKRFWTQEMTSWPRSDANFILIFEIMLVAAVLLMNAADQVLQARGHYASCEPFFFSQWLMPMLDRASVTGLVYTERSAWWIHIVGVFGFAIYVTYSKHLHIFMAFPNTYYARLTPQGYMNNMPEVTREVKSMVGASNDNHVSSESIKRLGAKDVYDLSRISLMGAYACTECGRCTAECPAHSTGKKLSPRKIMMDVRDRLTELRRSKEDKNAPSNKTLLNDYITKEEINACTSCNACVEACPLLINPLEIIIELRRYIAMEESGAPAPWNVMFQNIETSFSPWKFAPTDRFNWASKCSTNPEKNA